MFQFADWEYNHHCTRSQKHLLNFISSMSSKEPYIYLFGNFMEANKITYVKKGDGDYWFVNLVHMVAKLVRNMSAILLYFHKLL